MQGIELFRYTSCMNSEFHYYVIHLLALRAGIPESEAHTIACASQFVDNNIIAYAADTGHGLYTIRPTQNYGFWDESFPREVYAPFHFFPGDMNYPGAERRDGKRNPRNCTPDSPQVKELLVRALKTRNPYRIGIALHTYADSWAHQNFSGYNEDWNRVDEGLPIPAIGHAQVFTDPDGFGMVWEDTRLIPENRTIINLMRFITAAKKIYKYLCTYNRRGFEDVDDVIEGLKKITGSGRKTAKERMLDFIIEGNMASYDRREWLSDALVLGTGEPDEAAYSGYDKLLWLKDALLYRSSLMQKEPVRAKANFSERPLYLFCEAAEEHKKAAGEILKNL